VSSLARSLGAAALAALAAAPAGGTTIFVDLVIGPASCASYSAALRTCSGGSATAYKTMNGAGQAAVAGDIVLVRGGTYAAQFAPTASGSALQPIRMRPYPGEGVAIQGLSVQALLFAGVSDWVVEGLTVTNVLGWARIVDSSRITLYGNTFSAATATGTTGAIKIVRGGNHRILGNLVTDGNDNIGIVQSDHNLVQGNTITVGRHTLWRILCGNENVIRRNYFSNPTQKIGEVLDCEGGSDVPILYDATKRNLVEDNVFDTTAVDDGGGPYNGIQYAGQEGIVRRNVFFDVQGSAIGLANYPDEALHNYANRIYHNVFYDNVGGGTETGNTAALPTEFADNDLRNNVYWRNTPMPIGWNDDNPGGSQATFRFMGGFRMVANDLLGENAGEGDVVFAATVLRSLAQVQSQYPALFVGNLEVLPGFVNASGHDFRLAGGSPLIDAGAFLTVAASAGSGTSLQVTDASYFHDGFGIAGVAGDRIQLAGQTLTAQVVDVLGASDVLVLDRALTWSAGQGVALAYSGAAPDIGAFEVGLAPLFGDGFESGDTYFWSSTASP